jgi:gliding motility-associated-like protein
MKGQNALGTEFVCPFQTHRNNGGYTPTPKSQIIIVATDYNTIVWITPKCNVVGHPANITYSVALSYGQSYNIENVTNLSSVPGQNLSGTVIVSNKPIAVTVADDSVAGVAGCFDLMGDQLVPVDIIGNEYIVNKGGLNASQFEGPYIVATENLTQVTINDGVITTTLMNKGDTYFYKVTQPLTYIQATKNVYVLHESGFGCELGEAILPPLNCAGSNQVAFTRNNSQPFYMNILCKNGSQSTFTLNGSTSVISATAFATVPGNPAYVGAQIGPVASSIIPVGSAQLLSNNTDVFALGIFHGGATSGALYHYMSSFLRRTTVTTSSVTPICAGQTPTIALTGTVSGGAITGVWTTSVGTGTFAYTSTVNTIATVYSLSPNDFLQPSIKFYLKSTGNCTPKIDSVTVQINQPPQLYASATPTSQCNNFVQPISLAGTFSNAIGGGWSGGNGGAFSGPGSIITYTPSAADVATGSVVLTYTNTGGCSQLSKTVAVIFTPAPLVSAGPSTYVCTNSQTLQLNGNVSGATTTGYWNTSGVGTFTPGSASPTATYILSASDLASSVLTFTLFSSNNGNCAQEQSVMTVNVNAAPTVIAPADFTVCAIAGVISLTGTVNGGGSTNQGFWTYNGTGNVSPSNSITTTYSMSANDQLGGSITFTLNSAGSFCPVETDTVRVAVLNAPVVSVNSSTSSVCNNAPVALTGTVSGYTNSGIWSSTGTGAFSPTNTALGGQYIPSSGDVASGNVVLTLSSTNNQGCPAQSASFTAVFVAAPTAAFNNSSLRCLNSPISFNDASTANGTSSLSYTYNFGTGPGATSTSSNSIYTYTNVGSYVVSYTVSGYNGSLQCPDTVSKRITIYPLPVPDFTVAGNCQDMPGNFTDASMISVGNIIGWNWQFGDGSPNGTIKNPVHTYTNQGTYNVILTAVSNYSCSASVTKLVTVNPKPTAEFGMTNNPAVAQEPIYFSDFSSPQPITNWYWTFGDETSSNEQNPSHSYQSAGIFTITLNVSDNNGCADTISKIVEITLLPQVPTAFTPNGDNNNDLLFVKGGPFQKMLFRVYNNWGELLFETTDLKTGWDGMKNGIEQPVGVYVWTLEADMYNNRQVKKNGDVTLIR